MLAQTFLTANALGCSEGDRRAAIAVLGMLEAGELTHTAPDVPAERGFCIAIWFDEFPPGAPGAACGTVGCIGGWMEYAKGEPLSTSMLDAPRWAALFVPPKWHSNHSEYTPARCARALRGLLETGRPDWSA